MSNWYVRRGRERYWAPGMEKDKVAAYMTLYTALVTIAKAAAPMVPFVSEAIYQNLVRSIDQTAPESIHLCDFPESHTERIDRELEAKMDEIIRIVELGRAALAGQYGSLTPYLWWCLGYAVVLTVAAVLVFRSRMRVK